MVSKDFLPHAWRKSSKSIKSSPFHTMNREVVSVEGIVLLLIQVGNLRVRSWFEVVVTLPWMCHL